MQLLRNIALPFSWMYGLIVWLRNLFYDMGIFTSKSFRTPIICVGNLSTGGTGKTPMIEYLVGNLAKDRRLAVLSRGYRRKSRGYVLAGKTSTVEDIGDEPMQIHTRFPSLLVAVDANRQRGIERLEQEEAPDLILLDDAFQHRKVIPSISLLLTSYGKLYTDDSYLPSGNLRDSKKAAGRADVLVVTKCPAELSQEAREHIRRKLNPGPLQLVLFAGLEYDPVLKGGSRPLSMEALTGTPFTLITGIADPAPLLSYLNTAGLVFEHLKFGDHHYFSEVEKSGILNKPLVVTTEKDYVRMDMHSENLYYIAVRHHFPRKDREKLDKFLEKRLDAL